MRKLAALAAMAVVVPLAACGGDGKKDVKGTVTISDSVGGGISVDGSPGNGAKCHGTNGYDDIAQGADVVVHDDGGTVIGSSTLGTGTLEDYNDLGGGTTVGKCVFDYEVKDVEGATDRGNSVTVGHKRKGPAFDKDELGNADITIGSMA